MVAGEEIRQMNQFKMMNDLTSEDATMNNLSFRGHSRSGQAGTDLKYDPELVPLNPCLDNIRCVRRRISWTKEQLCLVLLGVIVLLSALFTVVLRLNLYQMEAISPQQNKKNSYQYDNSQISPFQSAIFILKDAGQNGGQTSSRQTAERVKLSQAYQLQLYNSSRKQLISRRALEKQLHLPAVSPAGRLQQLFHAAASDNSSQLVSISDAAIINELAATRIKKDYMLRDLDWHHYTSQLDPIEIPSSCNQHIMCDKSATYRSSDGTCNNLEHALRGASMQSFRRILWPDYGDGVSYPRAAPDGGYLPAARQVSRYIFTDIPNPDRKHSLMFMQWGQFLDHDITATLASKGEHGTGIRCCGEDIDEDPSLLHPQCMPLLVMFDDFTFSKFNVSCMDFVRSAPAPICRYGPRQQINQITSYIDGSNIYGSSKELTDSLREHEGGLLKMQNVGDGRTLLPGSYKIEDGCNKYDQVHQRHFCFRSGDARVNEFVSLAILHTLWNRQHNRFASALHQLNKHWNDEKLFQESRRLVVAMMQHITYTEYLPILLGHDLTRRAGLRSRSQGHDDQYSASIDPTISNVFATAAFRVGHSQIQGMVKMASVHDKTESFKQLHKYLFNPTVLYEPAKMDELVRGQLTAPCRQASTQFTSQITEHLFQTERSDKGLDLAAINIQRGRDHGLPSYNQWRRKCHLPTIRNFTEFRNMSTIAVDTDKLEELYRSVEFIDLYVGGLLEKPLEGAAVGPTFACILIDQFVRLKRGDRFWYENNNQRTGFTEAQLHEIRKTSLARVLCDNGDSLEKSQKQPMLLPSRWNEPKPCVSRAIASMDLTPWKD